MIFQQKIPSETWTQQPTSIVISDFWGKNSLHSPLTHLWYNSEVVYTSLLRVLCTITFVDVFNRLIELKILFLIYLEQHNLLSKTALANIKLALQLICRLSKILKAL